jgi:hypothetical protein
MNPVNNFFTFCCYLTVSSQYIEVCLQVSFVATGSVFRRDLDVLLSVTNDGSWTECTNGELILLKFLNIICFLSM